MVDLYCPNCGIKVVLVEDGKTEFRVECATCGLCGPYAEDAEMALDLFKGLRLFPDGAAESIQSLLDVAQNVICSRGTVNLGADLDDLECAMEDLDDHDAYSCLMVGGPDETEFEQPAEEKAPN